MPCALRGVEQARVDVDPDRRVLLLEVVRQVRVGHQVEPEQLHGHASSAGRQLASAERTAARIAPGARCELNDYGRSWIVTSDSTPWAGGAVTVPRTGGPDSDASG